MKKVCVLLASCYSEKRIEKFKKLLSELSKVSYVSDIVICVKNYTEETLKELQEINSDIHFIRQDFPGIGNARKCLYKFAYNKVTCDYFYMIDDDLSLTKEQINDFFETSFTGDFNITTIDLTDYYTENKFSAYTWFLASNSLLKKELFTNRTIDNLTDSFYYEDREIIFLLDKKVFMFRRAEFNIENQKGIIAGEDSTLGADEPGNRYNLKSKSAQMYLSKYGHNFVRLENKENGNVKFDFKYGRDLNGISISCGNDVCSKYVKSFLEKMDKNSVLYYIPEDLEDKEASNYDMQQYILKRQEQIFRKYL